MLHQLERNIVRLAVKGIPGLNLRCILVAVHLALYYNGICCILCHERAYICENVSTMQYHLKSACRFTTILHVARPVLCEYGVLVVW